MPQAGIRPRSGCRGHGTVWPIHRCRHRCRRRCRPRPGTRPLGKRQRCAREAALASVPTLASAPNLASAPTLASAEAHVLIRGLASQTASQWLRASVGTARPARTDQAGPDRPGQTRQAQAGPGRPGAGSHTFTATKNKDNSYRKKASEPQAQKRKHNI